MVLNSGDIFLKGGFSCETILPHLKCLLSKWFHPSTLRVSELFHQKLSFFWGGKYQRTFYIISFLCCFSTYDMSEGESGTSLYLIICILYLIYWKRHHNLHHRRADFVFFRMQFCMRLHLAWLLVILDASSISRRGEAWLFIRLSGWILEIFLDAVVSLVIVLSACLTQLIRA